MLFLVPEKNLVNLDLVLHTGTENNFFLMCNVETGKQTKTSTLFLKA